MSCPSFACRWPRRSSPGWVSPCHRAPCHMSLPTAPCEHTPRSPWLTGGGACPTALFVRSQRVWLALWALGQNFRAPLPRAPPPPVSVSHSLRLTAQRPGSAPRKSAVPWWGPGGQEGTVGEGSALPCVSLRRREGAVGPPLETSTWKVSVSETTNRDLALPPG